jgi:hypothetical protein
MYFRPRYTINTTLLICLAFIFRLLFVNISLFSSVNGSQAGKFDKSHFSNSFKKRRRNPDQVVGSGLTFYSTVEVCDEDSDNEEDLARANTPAVLSLFYSFFNPLTSILKSGSSFDLIKCNLYPKKYLALSILRI